MLSRSIKIILALLLILWSTKMHAQTNANFTTDQALPGDIYVVSCYKDTQAMGGFASSSNAPIQISRSKQFKQKGFFLFIDTTSEITFNQKYKGFNFFIVNKSDSTITFDASDSRLDILAEAYIDNEWKPIEYLPRSFCGNSYHRIFLKQNYYWKIPVPEYTGERHVYIRYKLKIDRGNYLYSNVYWGSINNTQLIVPEKFEW